MAIAVESAVNSLLKDDTVANGYVCELVSSVARVMLMITADPHDLYLRRVRRNRETWEP